MNWDAIGAIGQVLGSLAVFITLGYLSIQVRHSQQEMKRSARLARADAQREVYLAQATHPELCAAVAALTSAAGAEPTPFIRMGREAGLTEAQVRQVAGFAAAIWNVTDLSIQSLDQLDRGGRMALENLTIGNYKNSVFSRWYAFAKSRLNPDSVRYVDELLARAG